MARPAVIDEEAATTTTLFRAPAATITAAFLAGLVIGEVSRSAAARGPLGSTLAWYLAVGLVTLPFFLPSAWYRPGQTIMRAWITAAAVAASIRGVYVCAGLYALRPLIQWLMVAALDLAVLGTLWLAVYGVRRSG